MTDGTAMEERTAASSRMHASDIMTELPETVTPQTTLQDAARRMEELNVGVMPVVEGPGSLRLRGLITDRDIAIRAVAHGRGGDTPVSECMTSQVHCVLPDAPVREVFDLMKREQVRRVPVCDREGRLVGIIAQADLAVQYAGLDVEREAEVEEVIERISEPGPLAARD